MFLRMLFILVVVVFTTTSNAEWKDESISSSYDLQAVCFIDDETGWVAGLDGVILTTTDGADAWDDLTEDLGVDDDIYAVAFSDEDNGWVATSAGEIWSTDDGGYDWSLEASPSAFFKDISAFSSTIVWVAGDVLWRYNGSLWTAIPTGAHDPEGVYYNGSATDVFITTINYHDEDGPYGGICQRYWTGSAYGWTQVLEVASDMHNIDFCEDARSYGWAQGAGAYYTTNSGSSWTLLTPSGIALRDVTCTAATGRPLAWCISSTTIYTTSYGPSSWSSWQSDQTVSSGQDLKAICSVEGSTEGEVFVIAVGGDGTIWLNTIE